MERQPLPSKRDRYHDPEPDRWRWLAAALALAVHGLAWLMLRTSPAPGPAPPAVDPDRIRLTWSPREPEPPQSTGAQAASAQGNHTGSDARRSRTVSAPAQQMESRAAPLQLTLADDAWVIAPASPGRTRGGTDFRRPLFERGQADAFAPERHLVGLEMRDASLGGRLATMARMLDCGELAVALGRGGGALVGGGHDPGAARPQGGEASSAAILASKQRLGCR
jgi:hypothetical protein